MIEVANLEVAGFHFVLKPPAGWTVVEDDLRYAPFLNATPAPAAPTIEVDLGFDAPDLSGLPEIFDTDDAWRGYRDGRDLVFDMALPGGSGRLWTARLFEDRRRISIYCGPLLMVPGPGGGRIRNPLRYPLDQVLMLGLLPAFGGLVVHGAGAMRKGVGLAFPGFSGAGKSTTMRLMRGWPGVTGLSDDRVVLTTEGEPMVLGTPWSGDERVAENAGAPLKALVFLHQAPENRLIRIDAHRALPQLLRTACVPWFDEEGTAEGLSVCGALVGKTPTYELHFRPEREALSVLDALW